MKDESFIFNLWQNMLCLKINNSVFLSCQQICIIFGHDARQSAPYTHFKSSQTSLRTAESVTAGCKHEIWRHIIADLIAPNMWWLQSPQNQINPLIHKLPTKQTLSGNLLFVFFSFFWSTTKVNKHLQKPAQPHFFHGLQQIISAAHRGTLWQQRMGRKCATKPQNRAYIWMMLDGDFFFFRNLKMLSFIIFLTCCFFLIVFLSIGKELWIRKPPTNIRENITFIALFALKSHQTLSIPALSGLKSLPRCRAGSVSR